jgi:hypothetical protein
MTSNNAQICLLMDSMMVSMLGCWILSKFLTVGVDPSEAGQASTLQGTNLVQPTEYLRQRCPLCFGGRVVHDDGNLYASVYACLTSD